MFKESRERVSAHADPWVGDPGLPACFDLCAGHDAQMLLTTAGKGVSRASVQDALTCAPLTTPTVLAHAMVVPGGGSHSFGGPALTLAPSAPPATNTAPPTDPLWDHDDSQLPFLTAPLTVEPLDAREASLRAWEAADMEADADRVRMFKAGDKRSSEDTTSSIHAAADDEVRAAAAAAEPTPGASAAGAAAAVVRPKKEEAAEGADGALGPILTPHAAAAAAGGPSRSMFPAVSGATHASRRAGLRCGSLPSVCKCVWRACVCGGRVCGGGGRAGACTSLCLLARC